MKSLNPLSYVQLERRLKPLRKNIENTHIRSGWIHSVRVALGMSLDTLARLSDASISTIAGIEKREPQGKVTLETLRKIATAMDCELIYAIVPKKEIRAVLKERAYSKAEKVLSRADTHMTLEDQKVRQSMKERIQLLADRLLADGDVW
jgi:predicted DNA-binding mobile mystery protein A